MCTRRLDDLLAPYLPIIFSTTACVNELPDPRSHVKYSLDKKTTNLPATDAPPRPNELERHKRLYDLKHAQMAKHR